jgi:aminopeptidase YwaD
MAGTSPDHNYRGHPVTADDLLERSSKHLRALCVEIPNRRVGSEGNRAATRYAAGQLRQLGWEVETPPFACLDWSEAGAEIAAHGERFEAYPSPYSLGCEVEAPLAAAASLTELEALRPAGQVLLLHGELAREPLMPKNFPFYNPDEHRRIIQLLEARAPAAIVTATAYNPSMAGALYPLPMFEDGDFELPSVFMTVEEGARLAARTGRTVRVESRARRIPSTGCNVNARRGPPGLRVVVFAHIDTRLGTPGANDNASGVCAMLLLAEALRSDRLPLQVELVALNGEDYYANPGERLYLAANAGRFDSIRLGINLDDVGYLHGRVAYSLYGVAGDLAGLVRARLDGSPGLVEGEAWYQGDHGLFLMHSRPALAMTTDRLAEVMASITHSPLDTIDKVDPAKPAQVALALRELILDLTPE